MTTFELARKLKEYPSINNNMAVLNKRIGELLKMRYESGMANQYCDEVKEMADEIMAYQKQTHAVDTFMRKMLRADPLEHLIICSLYFKRAGWKKTATRAGYTIRGAQKYHKRAMEKAVQLWE